MAVLGALRGFTRPRSVETIANCAGLFAHAVRPVLANMVAGGLVVACKRRAKREHMRLVYQYELARDERGRETTKSKPKRRKKR